MRKMQPRSTWPESLRMRVKHKHKKLKLPSKHSCALKMHSFNIYIHTVNTYNNLNLWAFFCLVTTRDTFTNYSANYFSKETGEFISFT